MRRAGRDRIRSEASLGFPWHVVAGVTLFWLALAGWSTHLLLSTGQLRSRIAAESKWMDEAQALHRRLRILAEEEERGLTPDLRQEIDEARLLHSVPLEEHTARGLLERWDGWTERLRRGNLFVASRRGLEAVLMEAIRGVYSVSAVHSAQLGEVWISFSLLSVLCLALLAALAWFLLRTRFQAEDVRRNRHALASTESRFRTLAETTQALVWAVDTEGILTFVNGVAQELLGYTQEQMLNRPLLDFVAAENIEADRKVVQGTIEGTSYPHHETFLVRKDGRRIRALCSAGGLRDGAGRILGAIGTCVDVTHIRTMQERLLRSERLQAIGTLAGGVAHDFNNLLTVIVGHADFARMLPDTPEPLRRRLEAILQTADRARRLTQQMLTFARRQSIRPEPVDLRLILGQMDDLLGRLVGKAVHLHVEIPEQILRVQADWSQIEQVVVNLAVNSRDAMPEGGDLHISLGSCTLSPLEAYARQVPPGEYARIQVTDTGLGMDEETLRRAFEPFFTTKAPGKGTGLGLATVEGIVTQHGGYLQATSTPGKGTTMRVFLPLLGATEPEAASGLVAAQSGGEEKDGGDGEGRGSPEQAEHAAPREVV